MDRLQFQPDPGEDVAARSRRRLGHAQPAVVDATGAMAWASTLDRVFALASAAGMGPVAREALDLTLSGLGQRAAQEQEPAFAAGLRLGAALAGLLGPSVN
jgi:hypothetical protein